MWETLRSGFHRLSPALCVSLIALFAALAGTVYAGGKAGKINGKAIKVKSLPGDRLKPASVPADRLQSGALTGSKLEPNSITATQIDEASLHQVPSARHADSADFATDAETTLNAVNAVDAKTVNGHPVGCLPETRVFAGACWQTSASPTAMTAPEAAAECARQGGALPEALQLAAFSHQPGVTLDSEDEWSSDVTNLSGPDAYAVVTVSDAGVVSSENSAIPRKFRCVIPLVT